MSSVSNHFPRQLRPMLAVRGAKPKDDPDWIVEPKVDGYRLLAFSDGKRVAFTSRNGYRLDRLTRPLSPAIQGLPSPLILDGELVAVDENGHPDFEALQGLMLSAAEPIRIGFLVFDCLYANGTNLMGQPLRVRRQALRSLVKPAEGIAVVEAFPASAAPTLLAKAHKFGLEGVVCKRLESFYRPGERSKDWIKVPLRIREEFVIGGFIIGEREVGSLVVGQYDRKALVFTGLVGARLNAQIRDGLAR